MKGKESEQWWKANLLLTALALTLGGAGWLALHDTANKPSQAGISSRVSLDRPSPPRWTVTTTRAS